MKRLIVLLLIVSLFAVNVAAYGERGHKMVGAIADNRLAKNKAVRDEVRRLLDGLTLAQVASLPDSIKDWDACGKTPKNHPVVNKPRINAELRAFLNANLCNSKPSHGEFHYVNIPIVGSELYADGKVGRRPFDIVQMINYSIQVLRGEKPETNERAITKAVAIILITHYVGDIHQPLHVGAQFFDATGNPFEPTETTHGFEDQGGNKLTLFTFWKGKLTSAGNFHSYWDTQTVENAFGPAVDASIAQSLAAKTPSNWKLDGDAATWSEQMANKIMPVSREAHNRLEYVDVETQTGKRDILGGNAEEKQKKPGEQFYAIWAAATVKEQIHKGGWRLAALLEAVLK
jgi:hypothetical protein